LLEVPGDPVELGENVLTQRRGHFKVMATDRQIHAASFREQKR
jgi:hypothetical protein